jgi:hypothetical protein
MWPRSAIEKRSWLQKKWRRTSAAESAVTPLDLLKSFRFLTFEESRQSKSHFPAEVPAVMPGVYVVWDGDPLMYYGVSGRGFERVVRPSESTQSAAHRAPQAASNQHRNHA